MLNTNGYVKLSLVTYENFKSEIDDLRNLNKKLNDKLLENNKVYRIDYFSNDFIEISSNKKFVERKKYDELVNRICKIPKLIRIIFNV